jgi:Leucine Rich repeat
VPCSLSGNRLGTAGAAALAPAIAANGGLTSLSLSSNDIGGYWDANQKTIVFTPEGPKAIADALLVNGGLTSIDLRNNNMDKEGEYWIHNAVRGKAGFQLYL